ncbi:hypothetical protein C8J57DRAFT_975863, partial [Mycena rebaudengoi]
FLNSRTSPFATNSLSSYAVLLVSKAWLHIATPLLYHVVVIRSSAQPRSLQTTLRRNTERSRHWPKPR